MEKMNLRSGLAAVMALPMIGAPVSATASVLSYSESVDGEISDVFTAPTELTLGIGANTISGKVGNRSGSGAVNGSGAPDGSDADFFSFVLGAGQSIESVVIARNPLIGQSFVGYVADTAFSGLTSNDLDGLALFSNGTNFTSEELLTSANHAFWLQETSGEIDYTVTITVVPEPAGLILLAGGGLALGRRRK